MLIFLFFSLFSILQSNEVEKSVFKIYSYDTLGRESSFSGFLVEENFIITSAEPLDNSNRVEIQKINDSTKYSATIIKKSFDSNLTLLKVSDKDFYKDLKALKIDETILPKNDNLKILYFNFQEDFLRTIDGYVEKTWLAKQSYNWHDLITYSIECKNVGIGIQGGVVIKNNRVIGLCYFNFFTTTSGITAIPSILIKRFIRSYKENKEDKIPYLGISLNNYENLYYNYMMDKPGNRITKFCYYTPLKNISPTTIYEIDGYKVDKEGMIEITKDLKLPFLYLPTLKLLGDKINIKFLKGSSSNEVISKNFILDKTREELYLVKNKSEKFNVGDFNFENLNTTMFNNHSFFHNIIGNDLLKDISKGPNKEEEVILLTHISSPFGLESPYTLSIELNERIEEFKNIKELKDFIEDKSTYVSKTIRTVNGKIIKLNKNE